MTLLIVPDSVAQAIARLDIAGTELTEMAIRQAIVDAAPASVAMSEEERRGANAELFAFTAIGQNHHASGWGTYFGPFATGTTGDDRFWQSPDPTNADTSFVKFWSARASAASHPVLKARYADLAWDLARLFQVAPNGADARLAIESYLASTAQGLRDGLDARIDAAIRALDLSQMTKDMAHTERARVTLLSLHTESLQVDQGLWWSVPNRLLPDKRAGLTQEEVSMLVTGLESLIARYGDVADKARFNPHSLEQAAEILQKHYARLDARAEQRRLYEAVARAFEAAADLATGLVAPAFLQKSVTAFRNAGMRDENARVRVKMQAAVQASHGDMKAIGGSFEIKAEEMEVFINATVVDDPASTLVRIAAQFLSSRSSLTDQLHDIAKAAPLQSMISISITQDDHVAATIGPLQEDLIGRLIHQAAFQFNGAHVFLMEALDTAIDRHDLTAAHFTGWANRHAIFDDLQYLNEGFEAWLDGDLTKAIHVLVPQVERGLRAIADQLGLPITKAAPSTPGASVPINMSDVLTNETVSGTLGDDIMLHFRALYSDPRGMNLRNRVAHATFAPENLGPHILRLIVHSLLVLGAWKELAQARSKPLQFPP